MWVRGLKPMVVVLICSLNMSHPMWVRGLKLGLNTWQYLTLVVAPHVGAWIETILTLIVASSLSLSHPMWVRGLKLAICRVILISLRSHPMWVRGLKL